MFPYRSRYDWIVFVVFTVTCVAIGATGYSATPRGKNAELAPVIQVLESEAAGKVNQREESLAEVTKKTPELQEARWHSGYVRWNNQWKRYEDAIQDPAFQKKMESYYSQRDAAEQTVASQWSLANWCGKNDLVEQERVHLTRVLDLSPDHEAARSRLGWRRVGNHWFTKYEFETTREEFVATRKANITWVPQIKRLFSSLKSSNPREREEAEKKLQAIQSSEALDAMESLGKELPEEIQLKLVDVIDASKTTKASQLLAKMAIADPFGRLGRAACNALQRRPENQYVPALLEQLSCPIAAKTALYQNQQGRIVLQQVFLREMEDQKQQLTVTKTFRDNNRGQNNVVGVQQLAKEASDQNSRVDHQNAQIALINKSVIAVLKDTTKMNLPDDPSGWWQWWYERNGLSMTDDKPTYTSSYTQSYELSAIKVDPIMVHPGGHHSCFVAGTPVWTSRGQVAVDKVQAGDMVLSQNVDTGELTYKPVLKPTTRPPVSIITLKTDKGTIRCSQGHPFWVSGKGWVPAKQLEAGMRLHDVAGTTEIKEAVNEEKTEKVFNLIVADFHTYFVGEGKILVHDNSTIEPTSATVPGLTAK